VEVTDGQISRGQGARLTVDHDRRSAIRANHSATHLLHEALRGRLGSHVAQKGSLNAEDRLRFDFSHSKALEASELEAVEAEVNTFIRQNAPVETRVMTPDDAREIGAVALFGEKYGDEVRVVSMGRAPTGKGAGGTTWSIELCGGTHVGRTGDIGAFVLLGDSASSAGVRRIEALTGRVALEHLNSASNQINTLAASLKVPAGDVVARVRSIADERRALQNEVAELRRKVALGGGQGDGPAVEQIAGTNLIAAVHQGVSGRDLPAMIDAHKATIGSGVMVLIADTGGKAAVAAGVTDDLTGKVSAIDLVRAAVAELGGKGGGGRPDLAQGGGPSAENAEAALEAVRNTLKGA